MESRAPRRSRYPNRQDSYLAPFSQFKGIPSRSGAFSARCITARNERGRREATVEYGMPKPVVAGPLLKVYPAINFGFDPVRPCRTRNDRLPARSCRQSLRELGSCRGPESTAHLGDVCQPAVPRRSHQHAVNAVASAPVADDDARQDLPRLDFLPGGRASAGPVEAGVRKPPLFRLYRMRRTYP